MKNNQKENTNNEDYYEFDLKKLVNILLLEKKLFTKIIYKTKNEQGRRYVLRWIRGKSR